MVCKIQGLPFHNFWNRMYKKGPKISNSHCYSISSLFLFIDSLGTFIAQWASTITARTHFINAPQLSSWLSIPLWVKNCHYSTKKTQVHNPTPSVPHLIAVINSALSPVTVMNMELETGVRTTAHVKMIASSSPSLHHLLQWLSRKKCDREKWIQSQSKWHVSNVVVCLSKVTCSSSNYIYFTSQSQ